MSNNYDYSGSWRWAAGYIDKADLDESYEIAAFPRADDQPEMVDWAEPSAGSDLYNPFSEVVESLDGSQWGYGNGGFSWNLSGVSPLMASWLKQNFFDGNLSNKATVMTFDSTRGWVVVHCLAQLPRDLSSLKRIGNIFEEFPIRFINAVEL